MKKKLLNQETFIFIFELKFLFPKKKTKIKQKTFFKKCFNIIINFSS